MSIEPNITTEMLNETIKRLKYERDEARAECERRVPLVEVWNIRTELLAETDRVAAERDAAITRATEATDRAIEALTRAEVAERVKQNYEERLIAMQRHGADCAMALGLDGWEYGWGDVAPRVKLLALERDAALNALYQLRANIDGHDETFAKWHTSAGIDPRNGAYRGLEWRDASKGGGA